MNLLYVSKLTAEKEQKLEALSKKVSDAEMSNILNLLETSHEREFLKSKEQQRLSREASLNAWNK